MKYKGEPNEMKTMDVGQLRLYFNSDGVLDTTAFLKNFEEKVLMPRLDLHCPRIEEVAKTKEPSEEPDTPASDPEDKKNDEKIYTCKTCNAEIKGFGDFMTHCREHKKDGESK